MKELSLNILDIAKNSVKAGASTIEISLTETAETLTIRITDDGNRNSIVDTGSLLEHRQPEAVLYFTIGDKDLIDIPQSAEVEQEINIKTLFAQ